MQTKASFQNLVDRLKHHINEEFTRRKMDLAHLTALLYIFGYAKNEDELAVLAKPFSDRFPAIESFLNEIKINEKKLLEKEIEKIIKKIVVENPAKASEIAKAGMEEGMTLNKLIEKYPEIKKYI
ncbi:hypothetical protein HZA39_04585 [Candidatus Peregrinibacteria bacterium]|nr:hypothetical protein [Candidatus Peregrinibacteria bacterium]